MDLQLESSAPPVSAHPAGHIELTTYQGDFMALDAMENNSAQSSPDLASLKGAPGKSRSLDSSPLKMENYLFNFPIPTARTWTIMVEPISGQTSRAPLPPPSHPSAQLQHWKPLKSGPKPAESPTSNTCTAPSPIPRSSQSSPSWASSTEVSPRRRRRHRIYLNGMCIDNGGGGGTSASLSASSAPSARLSKGRSGAPKTFTFVTDKRMSSSPTTTSAATQSASASVVSSRATGSTASPTVPTPDVLVGKRRGRRHNKKFLTFHQLEFDSETLKPFDRSIFVTSASTEDRSKTGVLSPSGRPPPADAPKLSNQTLIEAAEILLELQTHAPSSPNRTDMAMSAVVTATS